MRKLTRDDWAGAYPGTNTQWLHYLADTLLSKKALQGTGDEQRALRAFRRRAIAYASANEAVWDEYFSGAWETAEEEGEGL